MELGNGLRAGRVSLQDFRAALSHGPLSLRYIQLDKVVVVDHLGRNIPVPTMFCSTWKVSYFILANIRSHRNVRLLIISSTDTAEIVSEIVLWSIKFYVLKIAR